MTSEGRHDEAYVWFWLPSATEPVVAGRVVRRGSRLIFNYARSYLSRPEAIALHEPELPLKVGAIPPGRGLTMAGCLRDGIPDAWGRRVILHHVTGARGRDADVGALDELTHMLKSGSDRIGALDFQPSPTEYVPRTASAALGELLRASRTVEDGTELTPELGLALLHGTSVGGARPKAVLEDGPRKLIAKFPLSNDLHNVIKAEFAAMRLAAEVGLDVAPVGLASAVGRDVLLVERFDRIPTHGTWRRRAMVSALTLFGLDEMMARYASYGELAGIIRRRFSAPGTTLRELFGRLVFNVLCGNTDDHARNHAAFWDGGHPTLTPAYDICPQSRIGNEAGQAMLITEESRASTLATCLEAAPLFLLDRGPALRIIENQIDAMHAAWPGICAEARLTRADRELLAGRMFLNPFIFEDAPPSLRSVPLPAHPDTP